MKIRTGVDFGYNELKKAVMEKSAGTPEGIQEGGYYYDTDDQRPKYYNGTSVIDMSGGVETEPITLYVDKAVSSSGDGLSWGTAFKTIGEALEKLDTKNIYTNQVNVNIKTGIYNEAIFLSDKTFNRLNFVASGGNVTLTGNCEVTSTIYASIYLLCCHGAEINIGDATYMFVCAPSILPDSSFYATHLNKCSALVNVYTTANASGWGITYTYGIIASGTVCSAFGSYSSCQYAVFASDNGQIYADTSGTGNTTVAAVQKGGIIYKSTAFSTSGTTATFKNSGGLIVNADGTLA